SSPSLVLSPFNFSRDERRFAIGSVLQKEFNAHSEEYLALSLSLKASEINHSTQPVITAPIFTPNDVRNLFHALELRANPREPGATEQIAKLAAQAKPVVESLFPPQAKPILEALDISLIHKAYQIMMRPYDQRDAD